LKRVIIDTDPGIDDAAAIFLALASPELSVEAITTVYGNGPVQVCTNNALRILHAAGRLDLPVFRGAGKPLLREPTAGWASQVHGADGLGNIDFPLPPEIPEMSERPHAALEIIRRVTEAPGEITLLALGRLTNLALALSLEPALAQGVEQIIVMGGAVTVGGNVSAVASANLYEDPEAAAIVYNSGASLVQVGLDVCNLVEFNREQLQRMLGSNTAVANLLAGATPYIQSYYQRQGLLSQEGNVRYNDVPAVVYAIDPALFQAQDCFVSIETHSEVSRGQTVADRRNVGGRVPNARVCLEVDANSATELVTNRISGYSPS
jgi:inosine-uridine nucleoside N-ribohydrolase